MLKAWNLAQRFIEPIQLIWVEVPPKRTLFPRHFPGNSGNFLTIEKTHEMGWYKYHSNGNHIIIRIDEFCAKESSFDYQGIITRKSRLFWKGNIYVHMGINRMQIYKLNKTNAVYNLDLNIWPPGSSFPGIIIIVLTHKMEYVQMAALCPPPTIRPVVEWAQFQNSEEFMGPSFLSPQLYGDHQGLRWSGWFWGVFLKIAYFCLIFAKMADIITRER